MLLLHCRQILYHLSHQRSLSVGLDNSKVWKQNLFASWLLNFLDFNFHIYFLDALWGKIKGGVKTMNIILIRLYITNYKKRRHIKIFFLTATIPCYMYMYIYVYVYMEKEMATHSSILAWRIPWMEEPGGLQSTGSQRVGHDWATSLTHTLLWISWY